MDATAAAGWADVLGQLGAGAAALVLFFLALTALRMLVWPVVKWLKDSAVEFYELGRKSREP